MLPPGTAVLGPWSQMLVSGPAPTGSSITGLGGNLGIRTLPRGSVCIHLKFENHHSKGFLSNLASTNSVLSQAMEPVMVQES